MPPSDLRGAIFPHAHGAGHLPRLGIDRLQHQESEPRSGNLRAAW